MTQRQVTGVKPEQVVWCEPIGRRGNEWDDAWLMSLLGERPEVNGELCKWCAAEVCVGTAVVEEQAGIGLTHKTMFTKTKKFVIGKGWRYDTMYLSLWVSADLINHHWWITYRHDPARALVRGTCYGFAAAVDALASAALAQIDRGTAQVRRVPRVQPTEVPAEKPPVFTGHGAANGAGA